MTAIPLVVPGEPAQWVLLDLQGDLTLRRSSNLPPSLSTTFPLDKPQPNCVDLYGGLQLGTVHLHQGRPQLRIGNALLDCQLRPLQRPLLVLRRSKGVEGEQRGEEGDGEMREPRLHCVAVVRLKVSVVTRPVPIIVSTPSPMPTLP